MKRGYDPIFPEFVTLPYTQMTEFPEVDPVFVPFEETVAIEGHSDEMRSFYPFGKGSEEEWVLFRCAICGGYGPNPTQHTSPRLTPVHNVQLADEKRFYFHQLCMGEVLNAHKEGLKAMAKMGYLPSEE